MMPTCRGCLQELDESAFYVRKETGRLRKECRECFNAG